jgi:hypothetical protein
MEDYYLEKLDPDNEDTWEEFNKNSVEGSLFHSLKWKQIVDTTTTYKTHYFLLFKNNRVTGIFPFIEENIRYFKGLVPLKGYGHHNAIISEYHDPSVIQNILTEFQKVTIHQKKISFVCLSTLHQETIDIIQNFPTYPYHDDGNVILNLNEFPPDKIWDSFSRKKGQRKYIRRFDENGFRATEINSLDDLKTFYKYYKENIDFIGGNPEFFSHFTELRNTLSSSDEIRIVLLSKDSTVAGGSLILTWKPQKTVYLQYLSLNRNLENYYSPSWYLYWEAINWAYTNKYEKVSFGLQHLDENNPRYRLKKEFGGTFEPIYSKMIPLSKMFTIGLNVKKFIDGRR